MHLGPRTRSSQVSLWNLPEELILYILKGLPIRDLLSMRAVSTWSKSSPSLFVGGKHSWFICKIFYLWNSIAYNRIWFVMQVNSSFRDIIDGCSTLWNTASFQDVWPSSNNIQHFEKYVHITKTICKHGKYENENYTKLNHEMKGILVNWFMPSLTKSVLFVSLQSCRIW